MRLDEIHAASHLQDGQLTSGAMRNFDFLSLTIAAATPNAGHAVVVRTRSPH